MQHRKNFERVRGERKARRKKGKAKPPKSDSFQSLLVERVLGEKGVGYACLEGAIE